MGRRHFYWECIKLAFSRKLAVADTVLAAIAAILAAIAYWLPPWEGSVNVLLWATPLAVFVGVVVVGLILAPHSIYKDADKKAKETQGQLDNLQRQLDTKAQRHAIQETLGEFIAEGRQLQGLSAQEKEPPPEAELQDLGARLDTFLRENRGESYVARLHSGAGLPGGFTTIMSPQHSNIDGCLRVWLARLDQFITELND